MNDDSESPISGPLAQMLAKGGGAGPPFYWMFETTGVLRPAVEAYLNHGEMTEPQIAALRAYLRQWIAGPWRGPGIDRLRAGVGRSRHARRDQPLARRGAGGGDRPAVKRQPTGGKMTQAELIGAIAASTGEKPRLVTMVLDAFVAAARRELCSGRDVRLAGLGSFTMTAKAASAGRNPRTGEPIIVAARNRAKFKPAKALTDALNSTAAPPPPGPATRETRAQA